MATSFRQSSFYDALKRSFAPPAKRQPLTMTDARDTAGAPPQSGQGGTAAGTAVGGHSAIRDLIRASFDPSNTVSLAAAVPAGAAGAAGVPAGLAGHGAALGGSPTAQAFYDALMGRLSDSEFFGAGNRPAQSLFEQNQQRLVSEIIPALMGAYGANVPAFTSNNPWFAGYLLSSALTGRPYYNPDMDRNIGNLKYIPGYAPTGPATMARNAHPGYPYYWMG